MVKPIIVGFCCIRVDTTLGWWVWDLKTLVQFQGSEMRTWGQSKISSFGFVFGVKQEN